MNGLFQEVAPLSKERVIKALKSLGLVYYVDSTGALGMFYQECVIWFNFDGSNEDILLIQADPFRDVPIEEIMPLRKFINQWNANTFWPRAYPSINDDGILRARCDYVMNCKGGITDAQIAEQVLIFMGTVNDFYQNLAQSRANGWQWEAVDKYSE